MHLTDPTHGLAGAAADGGPQDDAARAEEAAENRAKLFRTIIVCVTFAAVFGAALGIDRILRSGPTEAEMTTAERIKADTTTRTRIPLADGKTCREMVLDRTSGNIIESNTALCSSMEPPKQRSQRDFAWGRQ